MLGVKRPSVATQLLIVKLTFVLVIAGLMAHFAAPTAQASTCWSSYITKQSRTATTAYGTSYTVWVTYKTGRDCYTWQPLSVSVSSVRVKFVATVKGNSVTHWFDEIGTVRNGSPYRVFYPGGEYCYGPNCIPSAWKCVGACTIDRTVTTPLNTMIPYSEDLRVDAFVMWPSPYIADGFHEYRYNFLANRLTAYDYFGCGGCTF